MIFLAYDKLNPKNIKGIDATNEEMAVYSLYADYISNTYNLYTDYGELPDDLKQKIVYAIFDIMSFDEIRDIQLNNRVSASCKTIDITPDIGEKDFENVNYDIRMMIDDYMRDFGMD